MCTFIIFSPLKTSVAVASQSPGKSLSAMEIVQSMFYNVHTEVHTVQKIKKKFNIALLQMSEWLKSRYCISNVADEDNTEDNEKHSEENEASTRELFLLTFTIFLFHFYIYYLLSCFSRKNCATYTALFLMFLKTLMSYTAWHRCQIILC